MPSRRLPILLVLSILPLATRADDLPILSKVALQPLAAHAKTLTDAMELAGAPFPDATRAALDAAYANADPAEAVRQIQVALDPFCLAGVDINPESRVK